MRVAEFGFELPEELIAQQPPEERGGSRMLRLDRRTGAFEDRLFTELPDLLEAGDLLVLNDSRVLPGRLFATRMGLRTQAGAPAPEGVVEVLLTEPLLSDRDGREASGAAGEISWRALVKPAKKVPVGETLLFAAKPGGQTLLRAEVVASGEFGERTLCFVPAQGFHAVLERIGHLPLPPYIRRDRTEPNTTEDRERYQTVYSRPFGAGLRDSVSSGKRQIPFGNEKKEGDELANAESARGSQVNGSAAAPTAGLHFTPAILDRIRQRGVEVARVTLHVGLGTFQPVRVEHTEEIRLHAEPYTLTSETAEALNRAWIDGRRVIAVGTTTTRTLEHLARQFEAAHGTLSVRNPLHLEPHSGSTGLFLSPAPDGDDRFKLVRGLLTNFHLPQSTLLMLVSAFAGTDHVLAAYAHAVRERYRFFSYGDCMLVL